MNIPENILSNLTEEQKKKVEEAGEMLGISRQLAYQLANRDDFPCLRIGRRLLIPRSKLIEWVDNHYG